LAELESGRSVGVAVSVPALISGLAGVAVRADVVVVSAVAAEAAL